MRTRTIVCEVGALVTPDVGTIDVLARLQLAARRVGTEIRLRHASTELRQLLAFCGLDDVLPLEAEGKIEEREERRGVEEERDLRDPPA